MAQENRTQLKTYFETGDVPTQGQYENLIDSCYNVVEGLGTEIVVNANDTITIPAKRMISQIVVWGTVDLVLNVGDTLGSGEYVNNEEVTANQPLIIDLMPVFSLTAKTFVIKVEDTGGAAATANIIYYLK